MRPFVAPLLAPIVLSLAGACFSVLATVGEAAAISIEPSPVVYSNVEFEASVSLVRVEAGLPVGGVVLAGTAPDATDLTLVLEVVNDGPRPLELLHFFGLEQQPSAAGWIPSPEPNSLRDIEALTLISLAGEGVQFSGLLQPGETSELVFVSGAWQVDDRIDFSMRSDLRGLQGVLGMDIERITIVPEPSTALLVAGGLLALSICTKGSHARESASKKVSAAPTGRSRLPATRE